jgi:murein DD-endopeptidase MepM/ murein hydrolase activator NlpD
MKRKSSYKKKRSSKIVSGLLLLVVLVGAGYIYSAPEFEREVPVVHSSQAMFWNRKDPLKIKLTDNVGLKNFELILNDGEKSVIVGQGAFSQKAKEQILLVKYPKSKTLNAKAKQLKLKVVVRDSSLWNFFQGNSVEKLIDLKVDAKRPNVNVLANSYSITQGGSALVVFQAEDENLDEIHIEAAGKKFKAAPYKKEGYYAALVAWPFTDTDFEAKIIATDRADNKRVTHIPFYLKNHNYQVSWIKARDKFIDGKITDLASSDPEYASIDDKLGKLKAVNETMRLKNEDFIHKLSKEVSTEIIEGWKMKKFYPLKNGAKVASYGAHRHYYYGTKENEVSQSYHVGYDLASTKMASIVSSNAGKVVFAAENGIYGNMPMIDHGLGLYTLYGHCSQLLLKEGDTVHAGQVIAKTGTSGLALGDHLHFGILVQGIEVRPIEWFDGGWIKKNIDNIFKAADKIIVGK